MHLPCPILFVLAFVIVGCSGGPLATVSWLGCPDPVPKALEYTCCEVAPEYWAKPEKFAELCPDAGAPDAGADSGDLDGSADGSSAKTCTGDCVPPGPGFGWDPPFLFWFGPPDEAPACPARAPQQTYVGMADLHVSNECPACACDPPDVVCRPPASFTVHSELCSNLPGSIDTSFDPPAPWDGTCTAENQIPAGQDCPMGSGMPCVRSLTIGPLEVINSACAVAGDLQTGPPAPSWGALGKICKLSSNIDLDPCDDDKRNCVPAADDGPPPRFRHCVGHEKDVQCEGGYYTERYLMYQSFEDHRSCSECSCGPAAGGYCWANARIYHDAACMDMMVFHPLDSLSSPCLDLVPAGTALGGKEITDIEYVPGGCQPGGGELTGVVEPKLGDAKTICCLPSNLPMEHSP